jgi:hypothetical protein
MTASVEDRVRAALSARAHGTKVREFEFSTSVPTTYDDRDTRWSRRVAIAAAACLVVLGSVGLLRLAPSELGPASDPTGGEELRPELLIGWPPSASSTTESSQAFASEVDELVADALPGYEVVEHRTRSAHGLTVDWVYVTGDEGRLFFAVGDRAVIDDVVDQLSRIGSSAQLALYSWPDRGSNRTVAAASDTSVAIVDSEAFTTDGEALPEEILLELVEELALRIGLT